MTIEQGSRTASDYHGSNSSTKTFDSTFHPFGDVPPYNLEQLNGRVWRGDSKNGGSVGSQQFDDITTPLFSPGITVTISTN